MSTKTEHVMRTRNPWNVWIAVLMVGALLLALVYAFGDTGAGVAGRLLGYASSVVCVYFLLRPEVERTSEQGSDCGRPVVETAGAAVGGVAGGIGSGFHGGAFMSGLLDWNG